MSKRNVILILAIAAIASTVFLSTHSPWHSPTRNVVLTWDPPPGVPAGTVVSYSLYRSAAPDGPYMPVALNLSQMQYTDFLVESDQTYYYVVRAVDSDGRESKDSRSAVVTIP